MTSTSKPFASLILTPMGAHFRRPPLVQPPDDRFVAVFASVLDVKETADVLVVH